MQLGIVHPRILPASPQENGQHERVHRELERETARPPASNLRGQQRKFDRFQRRYNEEARTKASTARFPTSGGSPRLGPTRSASHRPSIRATSRCAA